MLQRLTMILSFNVCKHWPIDQSQSSMSDIFQKTEHVLSRKQNFDIYLFRKLTVHTRNFLTKKTFEIEFT